MYYEIGGGHGHREAGLKHSVGHWTDGKRICAHPFIGSCR